MMRILIIFVFANFCLIEKKVLLSNKQVEKGISVSCFKQGLFLMDCIDIFDYLFAIFRHIKIQWSTRSCSEINTDAFSYIWYLEHYQS